MRDSEIEKTKVSAADLVDRLRARTSGRCTCTRSGRSWSIQQVCRAGDLVVIMGAGPVTSVAHDFVKAQQNRLRTDDRG